MEQLSAESAIVETANGNVRGEIFRGISIFRGIPYGAPTGGANRFMPPRKPEPWGGVKQATAFGASAPQIAPSCSEAWS